MEGGGDDASMKTYALITPAYNEAGYIAKTIESVLAQSVRPLKWVIVDDGSTDDTASIIKGYAEKLAFIEYCKRERRAGEAYYASNVYAILEGYQRLRNLDFDYLAVLDSDIVLCPDYYKEIFKRFDANLELGIATGTYIEQVDGRWLEAFIDRRSTPKSLQVFRRACYEQIGGYIPCANGGEDTCTEIMARMHGWQTWSFPEIRVIHQRPVGTGNGRKFLCGRFRQGLSDYCLATHPLFMTVKCLRRCVRERPYATAGLARLSGFVYGYLARTPRSIPRDVGRYVRKEQMRRLLARIGIGPRLWQPAQPDGRK